MNSMRRCGQAFLALLSIVSFGCHAEDVRDEVKAWFMTHYAPVWENLYKANPEVLRGFWVDGFRDHPIDADSSIWDNSVERWQRNIERYRAEGLRGSTVVQLEVEEISDHAVIIRTRWKDLGTEGSPDEPYCGTFIAGTFQGEWKFTNYFTVECDAPPQ